MTIEFTPRELEIIRNQNMQAILDAKKHVSNIQLLYSNNMKPETLEAYTKYIAELEHIENSIFLELRLNNNVK